MNPPPSKRLFDADHWRDLYIKGVEPFLDTPRDVVRLLNALRLTYPTVEGEVNVADFVALESLRVFEPRVYDVIRRSEDWFAGGSPVGQHDNEVTFHDAWLQQVDARNREQVRTLALGLFPRLSEVWGRVTQTFDARWVAELRICSPEAFPVYFRFTVPATSLSRVEIERLVDLARDEAAFQTELRALAHQERRRRGTKLALFLEQLVQYRDEEFVSAYASEIISSVLAIGDELLVAADVDAFAGPLGNSARITSLLHFLLPRLDPHDRAGALRLGFRGGKSVSTAVTQLHRLIEHDIALEPGEEPFLTEEERTELVQIVLNGIRTAAADGTLLEREDAFFILYRWRAWTSDSEAAEWVRQAVLDDDVMLKLITRARQGSTLNASVITDFADIDAMGERLQGISTRRQLTNDEAVTVALFNQAVDLHRRGLNTADWLTWERERRGF